MTFAVLTTDGIVLHINGEVDAVEKRSEIVDGGLLLSREQGPWHLDKLEWPKDDKDNGLPLPWRVVLDRYQKGERVVVTPASIAAVMG